MASELGFTVDTFGMKLRNGISEVKGMFSEFTKYISPAYHHDRCERSVQMRLYSMSKREFLLVFLAFFALLAVALLIGLSGPEITITEKREAWELKPNVSDVSTGPFLIRSPKFSTYARQLWVIAKIVIQDRPGESFTTKFQVSVGIEGVTSDHTSRVLRPDTAHNRSHELRCANGECEEVNVAHLGFLSFPSYVLNIRFYGLQHHSVSNVIFYVRLLPIPLQPNLLRSFDIDKIFSSLQFKCYNPSFSQLELWFRLVFLVLAFLFACWFVHKMRRFYFQDWALEQKWMALLLPLLFLYNDPTFSLVFLFHSAIPSILDATFQATFLSALLLFWLCVYHGLRQNERNFWTFYLPKLIIVGCLWTSATAMSIWLTTNQLRDPTYSYQVDPTHFQVSHYSNTQPVDDDLHPSQNARLKFTTLLMLVVLSISISITILRFGVGVLEDQFVSQLNTTYGSSAEFLAFYALLNLYLFTMAWVYAPADRPIFDMRVMKDNPSFSMVNDSDEDILYASEDECRKPLTGLGLRGDDDEESD
ncbi:unnamed protein product [Darwinula stevensoni]|uniref:Transmembrane protein 181 n=1 Tax=Darwinula stevensoni TaxID=69355 RepID=A0A7R8X633_9CRUS|nr:unnamed protein product [Darwinula stevensoni]CAG0886472.1 unnamed protein product [Darwinula stevensoni]